MPEYAYDKHYKIWYNIQDSPFYRNYKTWEIAGINKDRLLSPEKIAELRNARKNKKYLIYDNRLEPVKDHPGYYTRLRYPGIDSDYIYEDISDLKLIICNGTKYLLMFSTPGCSSTGRIPIEYFINNEIVDPNKQDYNVVVDYVERNADADSRTPEIYHKSEEEKREYFLSRAKLYYEDLDESAKLVYAALGHYDLENC